MANRYLKNIWSALKQLADKDVWHVADSGVPVNGTSGSGAGMTGLGSTYTDTATGIVYTNIGTKASPSWAPLSVAVLAGLTGIGAVGNAKATYDFAVDGGLISTLIPLNSPTLPINSIILGGTIDITTTLVGATATIALGTSAGSSTTSLKGATAVASWTAGQLALVPVFTAATYVKLTAAGRPNVTIATANLTAGKFDINLAYLIGNA